MVMFYDDPCTDAKIMLNSMYISWLTVISFLVGTRTFQYPSLACAFIQSFLEALRRIPLASFLLVP